MKAEGIRWHELENEPNELGTLFRNMRRRDVDPTHSLFNVLEVILEKMPPRAAAQFEEATRAVQADKFTDELLALMPGNWACFRMGAAEMKSPYFDEYVLLEVEVKNADVAFHEGDYFLAAQMIQGNPELRQYWSDEVLQSLMDSRTPNETLRPRLQAWLQLQISVLAKWSIHDLKALRAQRQCDSLEYLLNGVRKDGSSAPGAQWLRSMRRLTVSQTPVEMISVVRKETATNELPSEATFKRWNRGESFPKSSAKLEKFVKRVSQRAALAEPAADTEEVFESARWYHWAARRFDSMLFFAELTHSGSAPSGGDGESHTPSTWLRAEFKRWQSVHAVQPLCPAD